MPDLELSRQGAVLTITLNRPDALNALNAATQAALRAALEEAQDPAIRAVVLTGAGSAFCAGQDAHELQQSVHTLADVLRQGANATIHAVRKLEKPVLAALNGPVAGSGLSLALACDARIASDAATFTPAFISGALAPDSGASWFVQRALGAPRAFEWLTTNRTLTPGEALGWGLVSEVVPVGELEERAAEVAQLFAAMPTRAVWETKRLLDSAEGATLERQLEAEAITNGELAKTDDFAVGIAASPGDGESAFTGLAAKPIHPVRLVVSDDLRRWRLTVLLRYPLAVPHLILASAWLYLALLVTIVTWLITLFRGRVPAGLHAWAARALVYWTHVQAYFYLIADPFPGFRGWSGTYPVDLVVAPRERQSRWKTLFRLVLVIPAYVLAAIFSSVLQVIAVIGWFASLALGRMPKGMRDLMAYCLRYQVQMYAYLLLLTSRYPTLASGSGFQFEEG